MIKMLQAVPELKGFCTSGLDAVGSYKEHISLVNFRPDCSANLDDGFKPTYPQGNRWDYYLFTTMRSEKISVFFEVHSCTTKEVSCVLAKYTWLSMLLKSKLSFLIKNSSKQKYFWIPSNGMKIIKHSRQYRQITKSTIRIVKIIKDDNLIRD
jgi:hypothetical protein